MNIYRRGNDQFGDRSPWERLIERTSEGKTRPLIIVYDEGHNLSEQQTDILAELEADAYLLASATLKLPVQFQKSIIQQIKTWVEEAADPQNFAALEAVDKDGNPDAELFITTAIDSKDVVEAQLVKKALQFDGTTAPMERCLDDLVERMEIINKEISDRSLGFKPKAIYVCKTNIADDGINDDATMPFEHRKAPPIRIWRYLVEEKGVLPKDIAIYADLKFFEGNKPDEVNLFSKGDNDFDDFTNGDFQHIIFNLSLQEGWDDPGCYLAYIDKSMGSSIQVEQVIGRVLRQYGAKHYDNPLLNSAHFFIRVDKQTVFTDAIGKIKAKLEAEGSPIEISSNFSGQGGASEPITPKEGVSVLLHKIFVESAPAEPYIAELIEIFHDYTEGDPNSIGEAHTATKVIDIMEPGKEDGEVAWTPIGQTNPVRLRWLVTTAIRTRSTRPLAVVNLKDHKFDVRVQVQSRADKQGEVLAREIVAAYYLYSDVVYESHAPFEFGTIQVPKKAVAFANGLYARYSGLNEFELPFAKALDKTKNVWHRNPSAGGFSIPLLDGGDTDAFYPDFIVWHKKLVFCLDTKGGHLISDAVARKLFDIKEDGKTKVLVRFITEGKQTQLRGKAIKGGYTVWKMKTGSPAPIHVADLDKAVAECLRP